MSIASPALARSSLIRLPRFSPALWYAVASTGLLGLWVGFYIFSPFGFDESGRDSWHHAAVLRELMAHPFSPTNPHLPTNEPSRYFTPLALLAALPGRLFGLSPYALFGLMGAANCIGLVAACWLFARRYFPSPWAPLILLLTLLFVWGSQMSHAGLHNYATWLSSAAYPATIALVLGLFSWALALKALDSTQLRPIWFLLLGALTAVTLLVHQLSAVFMLAGTGCLILFHERAGLGAKASMLAAMALGSLATLMWPYFPIIEVVSSGSDPRWKSAFTPMNRVSTVLMLAAPTFVGVIGFRKPQGGWRWELVLPAAFFSAAYLVLVLQGSAIAHRIPPGVILYNQLGVVWLAISYGERLQEDPRLKFALVSTITIIIAGTALFAGMTRMEDLRRRVSEGSLIGMAEAIARTIPPGSVSFATERVVFPLQSTGRRVVSIPRPEPAAPSLTERQLATDQFFDGTTSTAERYRLIDRWDAKYVVFVPNELRPEVVRELRALGTSKSFSHDAEVIAIDRTRAPARYAKARK